MHARDQRVAFDTDRRSRRAVGARAERAVAVRIVVVRAAAVDPGYQPRFRALQKTYRYTLLESTVSDPFLSGRVWRIGERLNHELMREAAAPLLGEHDFAAFRAAGDERENTVRRIFRIEVRTGSGDDPRLTAIEVEGNRFMYRMVRIIVGSLVDVGSGRREDCALPALERRERSLLGRTAPPTASACKMSYSTTTAATLAELPTATDP